jgi:hypothetical protein
MVYGEFHQIASGQHLCWGGNEKPNTTALVHAANLKLVRQEDADWESRAHFFAGAAEPMRHILNNATEGQHLSDVAVAAAGGWSDTASLKLLYQHATKTEVLNVVNGLR